MLIGRDHPIAVLRAEVERVASSHGGLVLVTGEAGIGKTTLVTEVAAEATRQGGLVLGGACWDSESAPGYWPWIQVVRALRRAVDAATWEHVSASAGPALSALVGEVQATARDDERVDSFQIYDAVTTALVSVSRHQPVVVVLDDLHWADTASLRLLEFAAQHTWFERLLLIGTYRDVEVEAVTHPLQPLITALLPKATTVTLTGLGPAEVGALIASTTGREPDADEAAEVHRRTGGNPFFVEQTARLWRSGGSLTSIAPGVRDALDRRLSLLPTQVRDLLTDASVLGREFHRQVLAATAGAPVAEVGRLLDQAVVARLVVVRGGGRFAFAHDLVRETLYASLDETQAMRRHAAVVDALQRSPGLAERVLPADRAGHAYRAGAHVPPDRAVDLLLAAANDAHQRMAIEESTRHQRRALERVEDPARRVRISIDMAANLSHMGERDEAWRVFRKAADDAIELGDAAVLTRVALSVHRYGDPVATELRDTLVRAAHRLMVQGAEAEASSVAPSAAVDDLARDLIMHSEEAARSRADDEALTFSLWAKHDSIWGPGTAREREALTIEMADVTARTGDQDSAHFASSLQWVALLEQGDPRYIDQLAACIAMAERFGQPRFRMAIAVDLGIIDVMHGRFAAAEEHYGEVRRLAEYAHTDFLYMLGHLHWAMYILRGDIDRAREVLRGRAEIELPHVRLLLGITDIEAGDVAAARRHVEELRAVPQQPIVLSLWLRLLAQLAAATADPALCEEVLSAVGPYADEWSVAVYGCDISGPQQYWLGQIDAAQGRWDDAVRRLDAARQSAGRLGARPWAVLATVELAGALLRRGHEPDLARATALFEEAEREAAELGMLQVPGRIAGARLTGAMTAGARSVEASAPGGLGSDEVGQVFRREGSVWRLGYGGSSVHVPDSKGLRDLHTLLGLPGADVPVVELLNPGGGDEVVAASRLGGDDVLDDVAKARYKRRLEQLDDEIDRAVERGADERAAQLVRERQALLDELRSAAGFAGRTRRLGDEAERARKTVTARIRDALRKLDPVHPELAAYLRRTVSTGAACRYQPDHPVRWRL